MGASLMVIVVVAMTTTCWSMVTKQSHVFNGLGSDLAVDGNVTSCISTGMSRRAWWMRTWDQPITFHTVKLHVQPPLSYFEIHSGEYTHPMNEPVRTNRSLCARIDGSEKMNQEMFTIRCVNTRQATAISIQLVGATRILHICELDVL